ncbi:hypothetical protein [Streptomyces sp. SD15]
MDQSAKRLASRPSPEERALADIAETWDEWLQVPSIAGTGLEAVALADRCHQSSRTTS